jgi:hypothetical protein
VLTRDGELFWYEHEERAEAHAKPKGKLSVKGAGVLPVSDATKGRFRFVVKPAADKKRLYVFEAYSESIYSNCVAALLQSV